MTDEQKRKYYEKYRVHIQHSSWSNDSKCTKKNCENKDKYAIFIGGSQLSNLQNTVCNTHLSEYIDKAIQHRNELLEDIFKRIEDEEIKNALKLVRKRKINELEIKK